MRFEEVVESCKELVETPLSQIVGRWKTGPAGNRVIGAFPVYTPVEIIHGAGFLPVGVFGGGNQIEIVHADSRFQSFICSIVKSTMELGLNGELKEMDGMLFHSICDSARNLSALFKRNFPQMWIEYIHFPQNMVSRSAVQYYRSELNRVRGNLQDWFGVSVSDSDLSKSISLYNHNRSLVRDLYRVRRETPHLLSAVESYLLVRAGTVLPAEEHRVVLENALKAIPERRVKAKDRVKVILEGTFCEQMPLELLGLMEEAGCYVMDDDMLMGWRWFSEEVPVSGDPLNSLAESYINRSYYSSVRHDWRVPRTLGMLERVRKSGAEAVIFCIAKFCEPALFDYVLFKEVLEKENIPHLLVEFEEKMWTFEKARTEIETFVESILFA